MPQPQAQTSDHSTRQLQIDKMATLGEIIVGIAHEINTPVGYMSSNMVTLSEYVGDLKHIMAKLTPLVEAARRSPDAELSQLAEELATAIEAADLDFIMGDVEALVQESIQGADQVKGIVADLRKFSRDDHDAPSYADLNECLKLSLRMAHNELKYKAQVEQAFGDIPQVLCRVGELQQVFVNLLINAAQAIEDMGVVRVETAVEGDDVVVRISDTGCGISPELREKVFEPFVSTKPNGSGVGLKVAKQVVEAHHGHISVTSEPGQGTTFEVRLPLSGAE